jgi:hypothetical protein
MAITVATPVTHAMIRGEDECGSVVCVEFLDEVCHLLDTFINDLDIVQIFFGERSETMASCIQTEQVKEEDNLVVPKGSVKGLVGRSLGEQILDMIKNPNVEMCGVLGEIFKIGGVHVGIYTAGNSSALKHWQNIRTTPAPSMATPVEDTVKVDRVEFPSCCHCRNILVKASNHGHMAGPGLGRNTRVRNTKGSMLEGPGANKGSQVPGDKVFVRLGIWFRKGLERFVGT